MQIGTCKTRWSPMSGWTCVVYGLIRSLVYSIYKLLKNIIRFLVTSLMSLLYFFKYYRNKLFCLYNGLPLVFTVSDCLIDSLTLKTIILSSFTFRVLTAKVYTNKPIDCWIATETGCFWNPTVLHCSHYWLDVGATSQSPSMQQTGTWFLNYVLRN